MKSVTCLLLLAAGISHAAEDRPAIGRLFGPAEGRIAQGVSRSAPHLRIDGVVFPSSGAETVWINGAQLSALRSPVRIETIPEPGRGRPAAGHKPATARVGETVDLEATRQTDLVPPGAVRVGRTP